jgi:hypothetical protein
MLACDKQSATAWLLHAEDKHEGALTAMRAAADAEDRTEKSVVTPGPLAPARELYGGMLLARGMPGEALAAFEATLRKEPNRFNAVARRREGRRAAGRQGERQDLLREADRAVDRRERESSRGRRGPPLPDGTLNRRHDSAGNQGGRRRGRGDAVAQARAGGVLLTCPSRLAPRLFRRRCCGRS